MIRAALPALFAASLLGCAPLSSSSNVNPGIEREADTVRLAEIARDTYVWGYPLVQAARIRLISTPVTGGGAATLTAPIHRFAHGRILANPETKIGVGPNNDTLYSLIWMDMAEGPFVFEAPDFGSRYYTFSLNQADSASPDSLGQRTHGAQLPPLFIHSAGYQGEIPAGILPVEAQTRYFELAGRTLVRSEDEYPQVHALQDAMRLTRYEDWKRGDLSPPPVTAQRPLDDPAIDVPADLRFLEELGQVLKDWRIRSEEQEIVGRASAIGLGTSGFDLSQLSEAERSAVARGLAQGRQMVLARSLELGEQASGWTTNYSGARFGDDFLLRAAVAKDQIYVAVPEEAIYPVARESSDGQPLNGRNRYQIRFPPGELPPVKAFWSVTLYDDQGFMVANPIDRYSIGDRMAGLKTTSDGSVVIELAADRPEADNVNWLPTPRGPFYLMMRLYNPKPSVLNRGWQPPAIEKID